MLPSTFSLAPRSACAAFALVLVLPSVAQAGGGFGCEPSWVPTFDGQPGTGGNVLAQTVFDDGSGPALYVAGTFASAGGVLGNVVRWDGTTWTAVGDAPSSVADLIVHDDGSGPALYASGGGVMRWDGTTWSSVGGGTSGGAVECFAVHDDGSGPALFAGGQFTSAGGMAASHVAKWDGSSWSALGSGTNNDVRSLAVYDDGSGPALHAAGAFTSAGGVAVNRIARWDGASWSALGNGLTGGNALALLPFDDGGIPVLLVSGFFNNAGGVPANGIARWDGVSWSALGTGVFGAGSLIAHDDGSGTALYAGGSGLERWDGSAWSEFAGGVSFDVFSLAEFDAGDGLELYVGGNLSSAGGSPAKNIVSWDGASWSTLGSGLDERVSALSTFDDGSGTALFACGTFSTAGGVATSRIGRWDGSGWSALGSGLSGLPTQTTAAALAAFDGGGGAALVVGGSFTGAGGVATENIAQWDGTSWSPLGVGVSGGVQPRVHALATWDDGSGSALYVAGRFSNAGGAAASNVARWDGSTWQPLGSGTSNTVHALAAFDDGGGLELYAGGSFTTAGGGAANRIARWDGASWSPLGNGVDSDVGALAVFDDGSGPSLHVGGRFAHADGIPARGIARWDGASWSALSSDFAAFSSVDELFVFDDGGGPALYAGGQFIEVGGAPAQNIARWDGSLWTPLGGGVDGGGVNGGVQALTVFDDGGGAALYAGGGFVSALDSHDSFLARWACSGGSGTTFCFGDAADCPCGNGGAPGRGCDTAQATGGVEIALVAQTTSPNGATVTGTGFSTAGAPTALVFRSNALDPASPVVFGDGLRCLAATPLVRLAATVAAGGTSTHAFGHGALVGGGDFYYQIWFRNQPASFCTPFAFNLSNGLRITW